jgi:hypothetical protein
MRESRAIERKAKEQTHNFVREIASFIVGDYIDSLKEKYAAFDEVLEYLHEVQRGLIEDVSDFLPKDEEEEEEEKLDTINTE